MAFLSDNYFALVAGVPLAAAGGSASGGELRTFS
jgi:hypothetical protein